MHYCYVTSYPAARPPYAELLPMGPLLLDILRVNVLLRGIVRCFGASFASPVKTHPLLDAPFTDLTSDASNCRRSTLPLDTHYYYVTSYLPAHRPFADLLPTSLRVGLQLFDILRIDLLLVGRVLRPCSPSFATSQHRSGKNDVASRASRRRERAGRRRRHLTHHDAPSSAACVPKTLLVRVVAYRTPLTAPVHRDVR